MQTYDFTLQFDNDAHSLTAYEDIPAADVVTETNITKKPKYYFEIGSVYGKITAIGGKTLNGKAFIKINDGLFDIEVTPSQEKILLTHYKKTKLLLTIKKKIDFDSGSILSAILEDYEEVPETDFFQGLKKLSNNYPNGLFSVESNENLVEIIRNKLYNKKLLERLDTELQKQVAIDIENKGIIQADLDNILNDSQRTQL